MLKAMPVVVSMTLVGATPLAAMSLEQIDVNGDGVLTLAEIRSVHPGVSRERFRQADLDANGRIDRHELSLAQKSGIIPANAI